MYTHVCGTPAREAAAGLVAIWPETDVTYFEDLAFAGLTRDQVAASYDKAARLWMAVAGITLRRVASLLEANIVAHSGAIDGPYGVLALSDLPYGATLQSVMGQTFDDAEPWSSEGLDMLVSCMCHEIGHALGLEHIPGQNALMDPYIVPGRDTPQAPDIAAMRRLYGPPTVPPQRFEVPPPPGDFEAIGRYFAPFILGPYCDALVAEASAVEAGAGMDGTFSEALDNALTITSQCWVAVVNPAMAGLDSTGYGKALRLIAKGAAGSLAK